MLSSNEIEEMLNEICSGGVLRTNRPSSQPSATPPEKLLEPSSPLADLLARYIEEQQFDD